jgi:hypothetical protein
MFSICLRVDRLVRDGAARGDSAGSCPASHVQRGGDAVAAHDEQSGSRFWYFGGPEDGKPVVFEPGFDPRDTDIFPHHIGHRAWSGHYEYNEERHRYEWIDRPL